MKNIKKQWFTLVELIVVITILAILWSIAFISLQGYSSDARNSKRTSDLNSIQSAMSTQLAQGQAIMSFATAVADSAVANMSIGWTGTTLASDYQAGTINYAALPVKAADFMDPSSNSAYAIGLTTKNNGKYELAASIEQGAWSKVARVVGNYSARTSTAAKTVTTLTATWANLTLATASDINFFAPGDTVITSGGAGTHAATTITKVSGDGLTITLATSAPNGTTWLALNAAEGGALIDAAGATTGNVVDGGNVLPY